MEVAAAQNNDRATKNTRAQEETSPRATGHRSCSGAPPRPRPTRGHEGLTQKARKFSARNICPNLDSRSKTDLESQRTEKKAFRARADSAQSARQGGTEPGTARFKDGRATAGPPGPRRGPGAPAVQPRPRGLDLESAQVQRVAKFFRFWPELGFEQRNRFRSLRDTRRTTKRVLRKPLAGAPVVGQTFKYIY